MSETIYHKKSGMTFDKTLIINDNKYQLISLGTRTKFNFVFYGIGLYSDNPNYYSENVISEKNFDTDDKQILIIKIYRSISRNRMIKAFKESIENRVFIDECTKEIGNFENILYEGIDELAYKDTIQFNFFDNLEILYNNKNIGTMSDKIFCKAFFNVFLDTKSVTPDLKKKL
jgi:hypothetical protein